MSMVINHNIPALQAYNVVNATQSALSKSIQKLSTGLRINSAADDAAGLAISEKMRAQINGLSKATDNAQDGISMLQTAEGALSETHSILQRMRELSVQAANDTLTAQDRSYIQLEIDQLREEVTRIGNTTQFNTKKLLNGDAAVLWSSSDNSTKAIVNGGLRTIDQFGQKSSAEGNYKIEIQADPGQAQVQKSDIFKVKHPNVVMDKSVNKDAGVTDVAVNGLPAASYVVKTAKTEDIVYPKYEASIDVGTIDATNFMDLDGRTLIIEVDGEAATIDFDADTANAGASANLTAASDVLDLINDELENIKTALEAKDVKVEKLEASQDDNGKITIDYVTASEPTNATNTLKVFGSATQNYGYTAMTSGLFTCDNNGADLDGETFTLEVTTASGKTITMTSDALDTAALSTDAANDVGAIATAIEDAFKSAGYDVTVAGSPSSGKSTEGGVLVFNFNAGEAVTGVKIDTSASNVKIAGAAIASGGDTAKVVPTGTTATPVTFETTATSGAVSYNSTDPRQWNSSTLDLTFNMADGTTETLSVTVDAASALVTGSSFSDVVNAIKTGIGTNKTSGGSEVSVEAGASDTLVFTLKSSQAVVGGTIKTNKTDIRIGGSASDTARALTMGTPTPSATGTVAYAGKVTGVTLTTDATDWNGTTVKIDLKKGTSVVDTIESEEIEGLEATSSDEVIAAAIENAFAKAGYNVTALLDSGDLTLTAESTKAGVDGMDVTTDAAITITDPAAVTLAIATDSSSAPAPMTAGTEDAESSKTTLTATGSYGLKDYTQHTNELVLNAITNANAYTLNGTELKITVGTGDDAKTATVKFNDKNTADAKSAIQAITNAVNALNLEGLEAETDDNGVITIKNEGTTDRKIALSGSATETAVVEETLTVNLGFEDDGATAKTSAENFSGATITFTSTDNDGNTNTIGSVKLGTFSATSTVEDIAKEINAAKIKGLTAEFDGTGIALKYSGDENIASITTTLANGAGNSEALTDGTPTVTKTPLTTGSKASVNSTEDKKATTEDALTVKTSDKDIKANANILLTVTNIDSRAGTVNFSAAANILNDDGTTTTVYEENIVVTQGTDSDGKPLSKAIFENELGKGAFTIQIDDVNMFTKDTKLAYNATMTPDAANTNHVKVDVTGTQTEGWGSKWGDAVTDDVVSYTLDAKEVAGKDVHFTNYYINGLTGEVMTGDIILSTDKDNQMTEGKTLASFEAAYIGQTAKGDVALRDLDKFWTSEGVFMLTDAQTITLTQGDGKQAAVTLYATDTLNQVADKLNEAISTGLGQGQYLTDGGRFVQFVEDPAASTSESVAGTFVIRSIVPGKSGELNIAASENLINALSLNEIQAAGETEYTVTVKDAHTDALIANDVKITGNKLVGVINENVDVVFDAMSGVRAKWDDTKKTFEYTTEKATTTLHLSDNTTVFQIGANEGEDMGVNIGDMRSTALGLDDVLVTDRKSASRSITVIDNAIDKVSTQRAKLGAYQNRLEHTITNLTTAHENLSSAESRIRDTDMAKEMMNFMKLQITLQAGTSMLAQANQLSQNVLGLLG